MANTAPQISILPDRATTLHSLPVVLIPAASNKIRTSLHMFSIQLISTPKMILTFFVQCPIPRDFFFLLSPINFHDYIVFTSIHYVVLPKLSLKMLLSATKNRR